MYNKEVIHLNQFAHSSSLTTRQMARELFEEIKMSGEKKVVLDFKDIQYASRSFFDELNSKISILKRREKQVQCIHLNRSLNQLQRLVIKAAKCHTKFSYPSLSKVQVVNI